jgi:ubiquinone/menaquinone biosynthesis C-methylase UbiE
MREKTVEYLQCPYCKTSDFSLNAYERENQEILSGKLLCKKCGKSYKIVNGILNTIIPEYIKMLGKISNIFYNLYAPVYDWSESFFPRLFGLSEAEIREDFVRRLELSKGDIVLEVGVGTGGNVPIIRKYTFKTVFGLDLSKNMLRKCQEKKREYGWDIELFWGNAECLPFKANMFDAVLIGTGITFFSDKGRSINEMYRVAKPGSKMVIAEQIIPLKKFRSNPPVELVPKDALQVRWEYVFGGHFYVIEFRKTR